MSTRRRLGAVAAAALATLVLGAGTAAGEEAPEPQPIDEVPALNEYVEDVPTVSGPQAATKPKRDPAPKPNTQSEQPEPEPQPPPAEPARELSPEVQESVEREGGSLAPKLRTIATSSRYGTAKRTSERERARFRRKFRERDVPTSPRTTRALGTAVTAGFGGGDTRMTILLVTLLATTAAAAGVAGYRHRPGGR